MTSYLDAGTYFGMTEKRRLLAIYTMVPITCNCFKFTGGGNHPSWYTVIQKRLGRGLKTGVKKLRVRVTQCPPQYELAGCHGIKSMTLIRVDYVYKFLLDLLSIKKNITKSISIHSNCKGVHFW